MHAFERSLPMVLHRALNAVMPPFREIFARHDLTDQQWRVLRALWDSGRLTVAELASVTVLPAPSLVGIIDRLEKRRLVTRVRSVEDRRLVYVMPTEAGRALYKEVLPEIALIHSRLRTAVSDEEWDRMEQTLEKIAQGIKATRPAATADE